MRFYTAEINNKEEILVAFAEGNVAYRMNRLQKLVPALNFADMNDLICNITAEHKEKLARFAANQDVLSGAEVNLDEVKLCAPIVHPRQDVICLGINYFAHGVEAGHFSEEAFGGERPYTIYFSKRVNKATATGETIPAYENQQCILHHIHHTCTGWLDSFCHSRSRSSFHPRFLLANSGNGSVRCHQEWFRIARIHLYRWFPLPAGVFPPAGIFPIFPAPLHRLHCRLADAA